MKHRVTLQSSVSSLQYPPDLKLLTANQVLLRDEGRLKLEVGIYVHGFIVAVQDLALSVKCDCNVVDRYTSVPGIACSQCSKIPSEFGQVPFDGSTGGKFLQYSGSIEIL